MPPAENKGSDDFRFRLFEPPPGGYLPCDTIVGSLIRSTSILAPEATITLCLTGRTKTKVPLRRQVFRNSRQLVNNGPRVIFKGPVHLPGSSKEPLSWPFAVGIPLEPSTCRTGPDREVSFIPMDEDHPGHHTFPATFVSRDPAFGEPAMCFVEYYLTAHLHYVSTRRSESLQAICRVFMRHPLEPILRSPKIRTLEHRLQIHSYRLASGKEQAQLSTRQKMKTLFGSSEVPYFQFRVLLKVPEVIQLDSLEPFPLGLEIQPRLDRTSDSLQDDMPEIVITDVRMVLKQNTTLASAVVWGSHHTHSYWGLVELGLSHVFRELNSLETPLVISTASENPSVDIGNTFGLFLHQNGLSCQERLLTHHADISPDFLTYNIRRTHEVGWQVTLWVAGRIHEVKFNSDLKIVAAPSRP